VDQGSVVEVLEPKPPGLGELAKDLALRQYSLLRPRQAVFRVRPMLSNRCSANQLKSSVSVICFMWHGLSWKRSVVPTEHIDQTSHSGHAGRSVLAGACAARQVRLNQTERFGMDRRELVFLNNRDPGERGR
jgi:hypothetical protein